MKLYTNDRAPNPRRLNLFLAYKGLELPTQHLDLTVPETRSPEYLGVNPRGLVPALALDDGTVLNDALAIALYLESVFPQKPLLGGDALERARIVSWDQHIFHDGFSAVAEALRNGNPAFADRPLPGPLDMPQIPALVERGKLRLAAFYDFVDAHLKGRDFLVGRALSWADISLFVVVDFARVIRTPVPEHCRALQSWLEQRRSDLKVLEA